MRSANSLLFLTLLIFLIECVISFLPFVFLNSPYSLIMLTVFDSRSQASASGLVNLLLLLRISSLPYLPLRFLRLFEVELSLNSSLCLFGEPEMMAESVSFTPDDDFPNYFLPMLELRTSFSAEIFPEDLPAGCFLFIWPEFGIPDEDFSTVLLVAVAGGACLDASSEDGVLF